MTRYVIRRLLLAIPTLLGVFTIIFILAYLMPGDPVRAVMGESYRRADPATIERVRERLGLNDPWFVQYGRFLGRLVRGDLGTSYVLDQPVAEVISYRFPRTLQLMAGAMVAALLIGLPAGILAAERQYTWVDHTLMFFALVGVAMPVFWQGILAKMFLTQDTYGIALFPVAGYGDGALIYMVLPSLVLGTHLSATIARITRSSMLEVKPQPYMVTAVAKGLHRWRVVLVHQLKNALIPVVTVVGLDVGYLLGGSVVTETIFNWPGLGRAVVTAINRRDTPVILGTLVFGALIFVTVNLVVDLVYALINPRIRYE
ncbi:MULTISPECIES: ABC transporter permease [Limnochorda]|mgnify:FL=1|uniref:ABC transporter permease n=1 Tax=Limnochorda TaxID=1676651 RepID=UPI001814355A|nr:ABC transporter permease [Limnochorda pilosa]MBO2486200.1 peptide ABC transporter permease [Bacillota bacterium]MBO2519664.1 peptide ABC transporter permease [Bacillota bacterium]NMA70292.1 ABC transporter permease [Bacillota bacterium]